MLLLMHRVRAQETQVSAIICSSMPLKMVMNEAKVHSQTLNTSKFNVDVVLDIINSSRMNTLEVL